MKTYYFDNIIGKITGMVILLMVGVISSANYKMPFLSLFNYLFNDLIYAFHQNSLLTKILISLFSPLWVIPLFIGIFFGKLMYFVYGEFVWNIYNILTFLPIIIVIYELKKAIKW